MKNKKPEMPRSKKPEANPFHKHLDVCEQCFNNPFNLCEVGLKLLMQVSNAVK